MILSNIGQSLKSAAGRKLRFASSDLVKKRRRIRQGLPPETGRNRRSSGLLERFSHESNF
jgi:hypothetical protein